MTILHKWKVENLFYKLALAAAMVVFIISILDGFGFISIIFRSALAFFAIYLLGQGLLLLWQSISPPPKKEGNNAGRYFDMLVGEDDFTNNEDKSDKSKDGHMEGLPGQVRKDIINGLPDDADTKAEMVRRMGWGENQE